MTSTGKKARRRYGNRYAAKRRHSGGPAKAAPHRRTWGKLPFSVIAKNAPEGAVRANGEMTGRIADQRADAGWDHDANVAVPGRTFASWDVEQKAAREVERREAKLRRRREREED
jgi:hypothetical protein